MFEAQVGAGPGNPTLVGQVSQSIQFAPFDASYHWDNTSDNEVIPNPSISAQNGFVGNVYQEAASVVTNTNNICYEDETGCFSIYGFEYIPGFDNGYVTWISDNTVAWTIHGNGVGANSEVEIGPRAISQEPMYIIANLGMSQNFGTVDLNGLTPLFPVHMRVDYIRVYQPKNAINVGCDPKGFPTQDYINLYNAAYANPNYTTWVDDFKQPVPKNSFLGQC
jgi:beta-glucanase (GH16 family)